MGTDIGVGIKEELYKRQNSILCLKLTTFSYSLDYNNTEFKTKQKTKNSIH